MEDGVSVTTATSAAPRDARERILDSAETLFRERGFRGVSLASVAQDVGIRKPSLYHHFPGGKEELFVAVRERMFERAGTTLESVLDAANIGVAEKLAAAVDWFLGQPPMFLLSMMHQDMPGLSEAAATRLAERSYGVVIEPLVRVVGEAIAAGEIRATDPHVVAGALIAVIEANTIVVRNGFSPASLEQLTAASLDLILHGALQPTVDDV